MQHTFSSTGLSSEIPIQGVFNVHIAFSNTGSVNLERRPIASDKWIALETFTVSATKSGEEPKHGFIYRFNCTAVDGAIECTLE